MTEVDPSAIAKRVLQKALVVITAESIKNPDKAVVCKKLSKKLIESFKFPVNPKVKTSVNVEKKKKISTDHVADQSSRNMMIGPTIHTVMDLTAKAVDYVRRMTIENIDEISKVIYPWMKEEDLGVLPLEGFYQAVAEGADPRLVGLLLKKLKAYEAELGREPQFQVLLENTLGQCVRALHIIMTNYSQMSVECKAFIEILGVCVNLRLVTENFVRELVEILLEMYHDSARKCETLLDECTLLIRTCGKSLDQEYADSKITKLMEIGHVSETLRVKILSLKKFQENGWK